MAYKLHVGPADKKKQTTAFLESRSAKASSANKSNIKFVMLFGVLMKELLQDE